VRGFDADIVVVCESWREHDGTGLLDPLAADGYRIETLEFATLEISGERPIAATPGEGRWELAICSRLPVTARWELPIGYIRNDPAGERSALACTIDVGGAAIDVVAVHVSSKLWKFASARQLRRLSPQLPRGRASVVAGDCNLWGPGVVAMLPHWKRAVRGRTYPAPRPHSQIDHVLVHDGVGIVAGEVLAATPSDHRPVRARLRVSGPSGPGRAGGVG
jgi:endonuclease/exonuclease/phosphatase family metal-dependent hydrolase